MNEIVWTSEDKKWETVGVEAERVIRRSFFLLNKKKCGVELFLVKNATMRKLNLEFRKKNSPTNILSFSESPKFPHPNLKNKTLFLGEIYLAPVIITKQKDSVPRLVIHGLLHLLGYTHKRVRDRIRMERAEIRLLKRVSPEYIFEP